MSGSNKGLPPNGALHAPGKPPADLEVASREASATKGAWYPSLALLKRTKSEGGRIPRPNLDAKDRTRTGGMVLLVEAHLLPLSTHRHVDTSGSLGRQPPREIGGVPAACHAPRLPAWIRKPPSQQGTAGAKNRICMEIWSAADFPQHQVMLSFSSEPPPPSPCLCKTPVPYPTRLSPSHLLLHLESQGSNLRW